LLENLLVVCRQLRMKHEAPDDRAWRRYFFIKLTTDPAVLD
jgi:hypothetical protein